MRLRALPALLLLAAAATVPAVEVTGLAQRVNALGLQTYLAERVEGQNQLISPPGISLLLDFAALGAQGPTRDELQAAGFAPTPDPAWPVLRSQLVARARADRVTLRSQAVFAYAAGCTANPAFVAAAKDTFNLEVLSARELVDGWPQRMERLFGAGQVWQAPPTLHTLTAAWAIHFIHFYGRWALPFPAEDTRDHPFWLDANSQVAVAMMSVQDTFLSARHTKSRLAILPYTGNAFRMLILLPDRGTPLQAVEDSLDSASLSRLLAAATATELRVRLPRFGFQVDSGFRPMAERLGIRRAFSGTEADFRPLIRCRDNVYLAQLRQAARIMVDEEGTRADAITSAEFVTMGEAPRPLEFLCDRPFLFLIQERHTGLILFIGRLVHPGR